jgi:hypothetical protein
MGQLHTVRENNNILSRERLWILLRVLSGVAININTVYGEIIESIIEHPAVVSCEIITFLDVRWEEPRSATPASEILQVVVIRDL